MKNTKVERIRQKVALLKQQFSQSDAGLFDQSPISTLYSVWVAHSPKPTKHICGKAASPRPLPGYELSAEMR